MTWNDLLAALWRMLDSYPFELSVIIYIFASFFPKRRYFKVIYPSATFLVMILFDLGCQKVGLIPNPFLDRLVLILPTVYMVGIILLSWHCTLMDAIYLAASAHPAQNIVYNLYWILMLKLGFKEGTLSALPFSFGLMLIIYYLVYRLFASRISTWKADPSLRKKLIRNTVIVMIFIIFLTQRVTGFADEARVYFSYIMADILALMIQFGFFQESDLERKNAIMQNLLYADQKKGHQISQSVEIINRKCHDLKHQIAGIRQMQAGPELNDYLSKIENAVMIYESGIHSGNKILDSILMDKILFCKAKDIKFSCTCDARQLSFMDTMDIYALFGNIMDNSIEAVIAESNPENRIISLRIGCVHSFLRIHMENSISHPVKLKNGIPVTTKDDPCYHGFGIMSIRHISEKYGGNLSITVTQDLFNVDILFPLPSQESGYAESE